jgi:hypothetical protein
LVLLNLAQYLYTKKVTKQEVDELKNDLKREVENSLNVERLKLNELIEQRTKSLEQDIKLETYQMKGDIARSFALKAEELKAHSISFNWWLSAAVYYDKSNRKELFSVSIKSARASLLKIKDDNEEELRTLFENLTDNQISINLLKTNHSAEAQAIEDIVKSKTSVAPREINN